MSHLCIRPIDFPASDSAWLEAILTIARARLNDEWKLIVAGEADVYLVIVESVSQWAAYQAKFPPNRLIACALPDIDISAHWRIAQDQARLPSLRDLIQLLNGIGAELASPETPPATKTAASDSPAKPDLEPGFVVPAAPPTAAPAHADMAAEEQYDPRHYLIGILRECMEDGVPRQLGCRGDTGSLVIDPGRRIYFAADDKVTLWPILSAPRQDIAVKPLTQREFMQAIRALQAQGLPLDNLMFLSVLLGSRGRIWAGHRQNEPVRLRQWPSLKCLPNAVEYIRLAAFMSGNTASLRDIAARTGVQANKVVDFHNACTALDLLERGGEITIREKPVADDSRELYRKIARRLQSDT